MRKTTLIALAVFFLLWVAAAWVLTSKPERGMSRLSFVSLDANQVNRIEITGPMPIDIKRDGALWRLQNGREADPDMVRNLLTNTARAQSSDLLSEDINRFAEYEVDDAKGHHIKLWSDNKIVANFVIGKSQGSGVAVRSGDAVYRVSGLFTGAFVHAANDWLQRRLFADSVEQVSRLNVRLAGQLPYNLQMHDKAWHLMAEDETHVQDMRFDASAAAGYVAALLNVRAQEILDPAPAETVTKLDAGADSLTWYFNDAALAGQPGGTSHTLLLGANQDDKAVYAKVDGRPDVYTLPASTAASLRKKVTDLRDLSLMLPFDPQHVSAMSVSDGKHSVRFAKEKDAWMLAKGEKPAPDFVLDPAKVMRRLSAVVHARAQGLAMQQSPGAAGLMSAKAAITVTFDDTSAVALAFGGTAVDAPTTVYVRGSADGHVYYIGTAQRDMLLGQLDTFKKEAATDPMAHLDPAALNGLPPELRASLQQQIAQKQREQQMLNTLQQKAAGK